VRGGIRQQILIASGVLLLAVFVLVIAVTVILGRHELFKLGERNAREQTENAAARAAFATLVGADDPRTAQTFIAELQSLGGIEAAELTDRQGKVLAQSKDDARTIAACQFNDRPNTATRVFALTHVWCVSVPVVQREGERRCERQDCLLGHLRIVRSTASVDRVVRDLAISLLVAAGLLLALSLAALWRVSSTISQPLIAIAEVMKRFARGERAARAEEVGPTESRTISAVYNRLIDAQQAHARDLEEQVALRTEQWRSASAAAMEAERYKSAFMAHMSHEMKTPLHVIHAHAREVVSELEFISGAEVARSRLEVILRESEELSERVRQILELARCQSAGVQLTFERIALGALAARVREKAEILAHVANNALVTQVDEAQVVCDIDKVMQIIMNLVGNSCRYTHGGSVSVKLGREATTFSIEVCDDGCGIAPEEQQQVWDEYRQGSANPPGNGFGLGLAIVRHYVQAMRGQRELVSRPGQGTRIMIRLPAEPVEGSG
jgi:signal transduction histidine kinase